MVHEIGHTMGFSHYWHVGVWNMMGARAGVGVMNTYERSVLTNWLPQGSITTINTPGTYNINLSDYETTGEAIKILNFATGYYTIENRSGNSFYSKAGNWVMPGNGMLITKDNYLTIECADHRWNWVKTSGGSCSNCNNIYTYQIQNGVWQRNEPTNSGGLALDLLGVCTNLG
jgi:flagellar basal body rod protein FlgG